MIAVIFEVRLANGCKQDYLDIAADMRQLLQQVNGFISVERFQSLVDPDKLLSLSFFRDEQAVQDWRNLVAHRKAQAEGRAGLFDDYRITVCQTLRSYGLNKREEAPDDSKNAHST